jgi:hypothetical protein
MMGNLRRLKIDTRLAAKVRVDNRLVQVVICVKTNDRECRESSS